MPASATVSIIICTHNRAEHLRQTLLSLAEVTIPKGMQPELVIVDNGSTDGTAEVIRECRLPNMGVRSVVERNQGLSYARNRGIAEALGEIFVFTDDDVRPPDGWLEGMCGPILRGEADAVAGGVKLAPHLRRPWMKPEHIGWLASTECLPPGAIIPLLGANMAFSRRVLEQVPSFDVEVGPAVKGHADDTFYSIQLTQAGYRVAMALHVVADHHLQESRLTRRSYGSQAKKRGEFNAYVARHWFHSEPRWPYLTLARAWAALWARRLMHFPEWLTSPTVPAWELRLLETWHTARCNFEERQVPRKYEKFGLVKLKQPPVS